MMEEGEWRLMGMTSWGHRWCNTQDWPQAWSNAQNPDRNAWIKENAGL